MLQNADMHVRVYKYVVLDVTESIEEMITDLEQIGLLWRKLC